MGAALLLTGLAFAAATAPLFDHYFSKHLAISIKVALPGIAALWLSLIWAGTLF